MPPAAAVSTTQPSARLSLPREALRLVGTYDPDTHDLDVDEREVLDAWVRLWKPRP